MAEGDVPLATAGGRPRLAFTLGDPAGIGPEVCLKALARAEVAAACEPVLVGCPDLARRAADVFSLPLPGSIEATEGPWRDFPRGVPDARCGLAAYKALMRAIDLALLGAVDGIVTAPLGKAALNLAGIHEPGHTEILAKATGSPRYAMLLVSERLACGFATCHQSLASVPGSLRIGRIVEVAALMSETLEAIRGKKPRIALLGLNPHAGEGGLFGREEIEILRPAAEQARAEGCHLSDPVPADTAFTPAALRTWDAHLCLYHDQGGIPFKALSFETGVNLTTGLPFVRTSPDHGTAYDIAWKGEADPSSMIAAALLAAKLAAGRAA